MSSWSLGHLNRTFFPLRSKWKGLIFLNVVFEFHAYVQFILYSQNTSHSYLCFFFFLNNSLHAYRYGARHWSMNHLQGATHLKKIGNPHPKAAVYQLGAVLWSPLSRIIFFYSLLSSSVSWKTFVCPSSLPTLSQKHPPQKSQLLQPWLCFCR